MTKGSGTPGIGYTSGMRRKSSESQTIRRIFRTLEAAMGPQHWWPAGSAFEVVVGAYLTQNTAWRNVELAMENLRRAGVLSVPGIREATVEELEALVRPAGYYRQKAARLKRLCGAPGRQAWRVRWKPCSRSRWRRCARSCWG